MNSTNATESIFAFLGSKYKYMQTELLSSQGFYVWQHMLYL